MEYSKPLEAKETELPAIIQEIIKAKADNLKALSCTQHFNKFNNLLNIKFS